VSEEEYEQRRKSSGINKRPTVSKDFSRYGNLKRGDEFAEKMARNMPYVLDQSTFHFSEWNANEALVDNWKPVAIVVSGEEAEFIEDAVRWMTDDGESREDAAPGKMGQVFRLSEKFGVPIIDEDRNELWSPE
jgi:predicted transcriptional regulator